MYAFSDTMLGCEIVVLSDRNDLTTLGVIGSFEAGTLVRNISPRAHGREAG